MKKDNLFRIDVLSIGLFGLAVGALTLGLVQVGIIPHHEDLAISIVCLIFGGLVQIIAGIVDINHEDQLGGTALTMYGFYWTTVFIIKILDLTEGFHWNSILFLPIVFVYAIFSVVMIFLTAYKSLTLMTLHFFIAIVFSIDTLIKLGYPLEYYAGATHLMIGAIALYHAMSTLIFKFTGKDVFPLGEPVLK